MERISLTYDLFADQNLHRVQSRVQPFALDLFSNEDLSLSIENVQIQEQIEVDGNFILYRGSLYQKDVTIKIFEYLESVDEQCQLVLDLSCLKTFLNANTSTICGSGKCVVQEKDKVSCVACYMMDFMP